MKKLTKIGIGLLLIGGGMQILSMVFSGSSILRGAGIGIFMLGVMVEIVSYAFFNEGKANHNE